MVAALPARMGSACRLFDRFAENKRYCIAVILHVNNPNKSGAMAENEPKNRYDIIEMAKKKRHIYLLEKMQKGKALSKAELNELKSFEKKNETKDPYVVDTLEQVADKFEVSTRTVAYWKRDGMPVKPDGTYDIRDIQEWRHKRSKPRSGDDDPQKAQLELWQAHERKHKALKAELELKRIKAELISRSEVERGLIDICVVMKRSLINLPREIVPKLLGLNPKQMELKLMERVKEIIQSFADETAFLVPKKNEDKKDKAEDLD